MSARDHAGAPAEEYTADVASVAQAEARWIDERREAAGSCRSVRCEPICLTRLERIGFQWSLARIQR